MSQIDVRTQAVTMARYYGRPVIIWEDLEGRITPRLVDTPPSQFEEVVGVIYPEDMP